MNQETASDTLQYDRLVRTFHLNLCTKLDPLWFSRNNDFDSNFQQNRGFYLTRSTSNETTNQLRTSFDTRELNRLDFGDASIPFDTID